MINRTTGSLIAVVGGIAAVTIGFASFMVTLNSASEDFRSASVTSNAELLTASQLDASLTSQVSSARAAVASAVGQVSETSTLDRTSSSADAAGVALSALDTAIEARGKVAKAAEPKASLLPWEYGAAAAKLRDMKVVAATADAKRALDALHANEQSVRSAVADWQSAQARTATAVKLAADAAAAQVSADAATKAAEKTAQKTGSQSSADAVPRFAVQRPAAASAIVAAKAAVATRTSPYTVTVRTLVLGSPSNNGQAELDAGGQIAITWPKYGTEVVAHNTNDPLALQLVPGDLVTFTGAVTGSFRVTGSITVPRLSSVSVLGQLGVQMYMQTCVFDSDTMRVVGLVPA